jgi:hypothetical protein
LSRPIAVIAWSMGGLVAMTAANAIRPACLVPLEPSAPAEIRGRNPGSTPGQGTFDPEVVYGPFPMGILPRPESSTAREERKAGISVPRLTCPSVVVSTREFEDERGRLVAERYGSQELAFSELVHWDLVTRPDVRAAIAAHLGFWAGQTSLAGRRLPWVATKRVNELARPALFLPGGARDEGRTR